MHETRPLTDLNPAPYNPRQPLQPGTPAWQRLERSLTEFGLVQPIVWNARTGHVVSGHQRLAILNHQGATEVQVFRVDLSPEREKALNITLNNTQVGSDWDAGKLVDLVAELHDLPDFDTTLTGFDEDDIHHLLLTPSTTASPGATAGSPSSANTPSASSPEPVTITLEIPPETWPTIRPHLDTFLAHHNLHPHIQLPT